MKLAIEILIGLVALIAGPLAALHWNIYAGLAVWLVDLILYFWLESLRIGRQHRREGFTRKTTR